MAKKRKGGRPKGSKNKPKGAGKGAISTDALLKSLGSSGMATVKQLQGKHDRDTLLAAVRTYPRLPAQTERLIKQLGASEAKEIRSKLLKVL